MQKNSKIKKSGLFAKFGRKTGFFATIFAMFAVTLIFSQSSSAWGPSRPTFQYPNPAPYVTFNSLTSDPSWGDERNFTAIKDITSTNASCTPITNSSLAYNGLENGANVATSGFGDTAEAQNGHCYMVEMFVHNNAAANLNLVATGVKAKVQLPTYSSSRIINGSSVNAIGLQGQIHADNCGITNNTQSGTKCSFWDEAYLTSSSSAFSVDYIEGSTQYYNNQKNFSTAGFALGDNMINANGTAGAGEMLGYEKMDGRIPGCFEYSGYVTFLVKVSDSTPNYTWNKQVRIAGSSPTPWSSSTSSVTANPGDTVQYLLTFTNTGNTQIGSSGNQGIVVQDYLSKDLTYINGSTQAILAGNPTVTLNDSWLGTDMNPGSGQNIGGYGAGTNAQIQFSAKIPEASALLCGVNTIENVAIVLTPNDGSQVSTAEVTVDNKCEKPCPTNPSVPVDNPACQPCPTNPNLPSTSSECVKCKTNPELPEGDPKCVKAPITGYSKVVVSIASLFGFLALATIMIVALSRKKKLKR